MSGLCLFSRFGVSPGFGENAMNHASGSPRHNVSFGDAEDEDQCNVADNTYQDRNKKTSQLHEDCAPGNVDLNCAIGKPNHNSHHAGRQQHAPQ